MGHRLLKDKAKENILNDFIKSERRKGLTPQGLAAVKKRIPKLFTYLNENNLNPYRLSFSDAQGYQGWLIEGGRDDGGEYASGTIRNYLKAATRFYNYLKESGKILSNPFLNIEKVRVTKPLPMNVLKEKQINLLLNHIAYFDQHNDLYAQIRYYKAHVACELLYSTALRVGEASVLQEEDIDLDRRMITVNGGKGGYSSRVVFLNEYAADVLRLYLYDMKELTLGGYTRKHLNLFNMSRERLFWLINTVLKESCELLDLPVMTSHGFRHSFGFHFLRSGCDIRFIQGFLGHKNINNTQIYTKVEKEDLRNVLDNYHPRKWRT